MWGHSRNTVPILQATRGKEVQCPRPCARDFRFTDMNITSGQNKHIQLYTWNSTKKDRHSKTDTGIPGKKRLCLLQIQKFINVSTSACNWIQSWTRRVQSTFWGLVSTSISILSSHLCLGPSRRTNKQYQKQTSCHIVPFPCIASQKFPSTIVRYLAHNKHCSRFCKLTYGEIMIKSIAL